MSREASAKRLSPPIARHKTAIRRSGLSRPIQLAIDHELLSPETTFFDYGCGHGDDVGRLRRRGIDATGWDPVHRPKTPKASARVVNLGFVINVIENPSERARVLRDAWELAEGLLIVSARLVSEKKSLSAEELADGYLTSKGTFQKFYEQDELRNWVDSVTGEASVPAGLGVLYLFRDPEERESFLARRFWRRSIHRPSRLESEKLFDQHRPLFEELMDFLDRHGRLPHEEELPSGAALVAVSRSLRRAYGVLKKVTGEAHWESVRERRTEDLLVYIALSRFRGRPRLGTLPMSLQRDVRAFFGTYTKACVAADELLFALGDATARRRACRESPVGKLTPTALYIHRSALERMPPALRIYEGCARALIGEVEFGTLIKLHYQEPKVSYLEYAKFDRDPHPSLGRSFLVDLQARRESLRDYREAGNPPILHRKEEFVAEDYPGREKFARLTRQEERAGLYERTERIGTRDGWEVVLRECGRELKGHRLMRLKLYRDS